MADPSDRRARAAAYIQEARRARGFSARRPTTEEIEQRALFRFETAFAGWVSDRSALLRQYRDAFEKEQTGSWRPDGFEKWLPADARAEVCAELAHLRRAFVEEIEAAGEVSLPPPRFAAIIRCVGDFVRRARWRRHPKDHAARRSKARAEAKRRVERVQDRLRDLAAALRLLRAQDDDPLLSDELFGLQLEVHDSVLGEALQERTQKLGDVVEPNVLGDDGGFLLGEVERAVVDLGQRLDAWAPSPHKPLWPTLVEPLMRVYERSSNRRAAADWSHGTATPIGPFSRLLVLVYGALPPEARQHASARSAQFVENAKELLAKMRKGLAQDDGGK